MPRRTGHIDRVVQRVVCLQKHRSRHMQATLSTSHDLLHPGGAKTFRSQIIYSDDSLMSRTSTVDYATKAYIVIWNEAKLNTAADNSYRNILTSYMIHSVSNISRIYSQQPQTTSMPKQSRMQYLIVRTCKHAWGTRVKLLFVIIALVLYFNVRKNRSSTINKCRCFTASMTLLEDII